MEKFTTLRSTESNYKKKSSDGTRESGIFWSVVEEGRFMDFVILYLVIFVLTIVLLLTPMNVVLRRFHDYLSSLGSGEEET